MTSIDLAYRRILSDMLEDDSPMECEAWATRHLKRKGGEWKRCSYSSRQVFQTPHCPVHLCAFHAKKLMNGKRVFCYTIGAIDGAGFSVQMQGKGNA